MKKISIISTFCVVAIILATAFKSSEAKEYLTIYYNDFNREISVSSSNGTYKTIEFAKGQGIGDQTQLLKIIKEYEGLGFKIEAYDFEPSATQSSKAATLVLMTK